MYFIFPLEKPQFELTTKPKNNNLFDFILDPVGKCSVNMIAMCIVWTYTMSTSCHWWCEGTYKQHNAHDDALQQSCSNQSCDVLGFHILHCF